VGQGTCRRTGRGDISPDRTQTRAEAHALRVGTPLDQPIKEE
jgi:hypothetical protein